jgi:hypothetical protein
MQKVRSLSWSLMAQKEAAEIAKNRDVLERFRAANPDISREPGRAAWRGAAANHASNPN